MTGLAGRITVNPALLSQSVEPHRLQHVAGDGGRRYHAFGLSLFAADLGDIHLLAARPDSVRAATPFTGTITNYMQQFLSQQGNAATSATQLQQGQDVVVSTLAAEVQFDLRRQHRHRNVEPDRAAEYLCRQCSRDVGGSKHDDRPCCRLKCKAIQMSINSINYGRLRSSASRCRTSTTSSPTCRRSSRPARSRPPMPAWASTRDLRSPRGRSLRTFPRSPTR